MYSQIRSYHILGFEFVKSVSLLDKIGILYLFLSVLSIVVDWFCPDCSDVLESTEIFISDCS